jgi:hypothetical protein
VSPILKGAVAELQAALPPGGLFQGRGWRWSDQPLRLDPADHKFLEALGKRLTAFLKAANRLYHASVAGKAPAFVAEWLDQGKPEEVIRLGREETLRSAIPRVLRPDLLRTEEGWALTEIDAVPGGVGLTAWMQENYAKTGSAVVGGANGLRNLAEKVLGSQGEVVISKEASDYRPEWQWLAGDDRVHSAENYRLGDRSIYRFFEMFDWMELEGIRSLWNPKTLMEPPPKAFLEEKLWWALFWIKPLEDWWRKELGEGYFRDLRALVPRAWPLRPMELPPEGVLPELEIQSWLDLENFSQRARDLVIKVSGFSARAWGSRGVTVGHDQPKEHWVRALRQGLADWKTQPHLLQRFARLGTVAHPVWNEARGEMEEGRWRLRLCPYYLVTGDQVELKGALATLCPVDKKLVHGMEDAVLVPLSSESGTGRSKEMADGR